MVELAFTHGSRREAEDLALIEAARIGRPRADLEVRPANGGGWLVLVEARR